MSFDIVHRVGIDDSAVGQGFRRVEAAAKSSGQRVGEALERKTAGARKLAGALGSTVGIMTSMVGAVTAVAGVMAGAVALSQRWANYDQRRVSLLNQQYESQRRIRRELETRSLASRASLGSVGAQRELEVRQITADADARLEMLDQEVAARRRKYQLQQSGRGVANRLTGMIIGPEAAADQIPVPGGFTQDLNRRLFGERHSIISQSSVALGETRQAHLIADELERRGIIGEIASLRGHSEQGALIKAGIASDKRFAELNRELRLADTDEEKARLQGLVDLERERHQAEIEHIREAHRLKRDAAADDARRARETREREERNARFTVRQQTATLEAQRLRLQGHEREATLIESQVRHNERLRSIGDMHGIGMLQRIGLVGSAVALFEAERASLVGGGVAGGSITGFRGASAIQARQALGRSRSQVDPEGAHRERDAALQTGQFNTQREINRKMDSLRIIGDALIDMRSILQDQARKLGLS